MKKFLKGPGFILILAVCIIVIALSFSNTWEPEELEYTELLQAIEDGKIAKLQTINQNIYGIYVDSKYAESFPQKYDFTSYTSTISGFQEDVNKITAKLKGIDVDTVTPTDYNFTWLPTQETTIPFWVTYIPYILLFGALIFFWVVISRQTRSEGNKVTSFSKSRAVRYDGMQKKVTFADVAGSEEEKQELQEIVEFLKDKSRFERLGARIPKGVLLVGPPGTGKTYLARAVAGEAGVPFLSISGSDFVEMFVGVGASRVRDLFNQAKKLLPCIIFIDEIDAVGRQRGTGLGGGHDEREQTLNQILVEMDGFTANSGLIIIAATNRADILDPALTRPGRFDRTIFVNVPDVAAREKIFAIHSKNKPLDDSINIQVLAKMTPGFTPADIENTMNEAAILAARSNKSKISMTEISEAIKRVSMGPEKHSLRVTENDKRITAYHEAGHAIVSKFTPKSMPVEEISIIPRGNAAGYTSYLPEDDKQFITKLYLEGNIKTCMGGRIAEELIFNDVSTGAYGDIIQATNIARKMITEYGMSDKLGPINYSDDNHEVFIGRSLGVSKSYSEETASVIDEEVKKLIDRCYREATAILQNNLDKLHKLAAVLLEKEKITGDEFNAMFETPAAISSESEIVTE